MTTGTRRTCERPRPPPPLPRTDTVYMTTNQGLHTRGACTGGGDVAVGVIHRHANTPSPQTPTNFPGTTWGA